ncbi:MAG: gliding motility-associated C-terminal domain-containing protein [Saprospiraceae bacterium]|nr:gliding motility-associated C-terminal domain-containing protein [Saprospiraceae bacterium]
MNLSRYLLFLTVICGVKITLSAQNPCNYTAGYTCSTAPIICDLSCLDGFVGTTPLASAVVWTLPEQPQYVCTTGGNPQNMSWFAFIAGSNHAQITITPFNCANNDGIQAGIFDDCDFSDAVFNNNPYAPEYIDCESPDGDMSAITLESFNLIPGQIYYFYVDGYEGDVCSYKVDIISATQHFELHNLTSFTQGNDTVQICPNTSYTLGVDSLKLDIYYYWKINPATTSLPYDTFTRLDSIVNWTFRDTGEYTISMFATNGCDITDTIQKTFKVYELPDEDFGTISQCSNEFPFGGPQDIDPNGDGVFGWQGPNITAPGRDSFLVNRPDGCSFWQYITVDPLPLQPRETVTLVDCQPFAYHDLILDDTYKNFPYTLPVNDRNGCDSMVMINAYIPVISANLSPSACSNGEITVSCSANVASSPGGHVLNYIWKDEFNNIIVDNDANPATISINSKIDLNLSVTMTVLGKVCQIDLPSLQLDPSLELPLSPQTNAWDLEICKDVPTSNYSVQGSAGTLSYVWTTNNGAIIDGNATGNSVNIDFLEVDNNVTICAAAVNGCGEGPPSCLDVSFLDRPNPDLPTQLSICEDSVVNVAIQNQMMVGATYLWTVNGANVVSGNPNTFGPLGLRYAQPGNYQVTVTASNKECVGTPDVVNIEVIPAITQVQIQAVSYANKVEVNWTPVPCVAQYKIYKDGLYQGTTTFTTTIFESLKPGDTFVVRIDAEGVGCACGVSSASSQVATLSCDEVQIALSAPSYLVCEPDWGISLPLSSVLTGAMTNGIGLWNGPGVLTSNEFLPSLAGPGSHKLYFNYEELGCAYKDSLTIINIKSPDASVLPTDPECKEDDSGTIEVIPSAAGSNYNYYLDGQRVNGPMLSGVSIGNHQLEIIDGNLCKIVKSVDIHPPTYPTVSFIMDEGPFFDNQNIDITLKELVGEQQLIDSIEWYVNGELFCAGNCYSSRFTFEEGGTYVHQVIIYYKNCLMEERFDLVVKDSPKVYVSNIFSASASSGANGIWKVVTNDPALVLHELSVFSRWGERMYHKTNFTISENEGLWDGTFRGQKVQPGVYVYQLTYTNEKGEEVMLTGDITVVR